MYDFTTIGAAAGLAIAIVLIIRKFHPAYGLIFGALVGGIIGGGGLVTTVGTMVGGAQSMMSSVLRIMTSGILAGSLIKTGSAQKIAETIVDKLGERLALAAAAMVHAGATVIDSLPHGFFFHATGGSVNMSTGDRMKLIPFEACVGLSATLISVIMCESRFF